MSALCRAYKLLANTGSSLCKYLLLFLQLDRGLRALDVIAAWLAAVSGNPARFPVSHRLWAAVLARPLHGRARDTLLVSWNEADAAVVFGEVGALLGEILEVCRSVLGADVQSTDVEAIVTAQRAVLPRWDAATGEWPLPHDVPAYFDALRAAVSVAAPPPGFRPLREYGPGLLRVDETRAPGAFDDFGAPAVGFELRSNLSASA
jgi:hypothetical protein